MKLRKSHSYVFTADIESAADMIRIQETKNSVRMLNRLSPVKNRVVLRGRKPAVKMHLYRSTNAVSYGWFGNIVGGIANATMIDVYIYRR